jgi:hypothetical protein
VAAILDRAGASVRQFEQQFAVLLSDETYDQRERRDPKLEMWLPARMEESYTHQVDRLPTELAWFHHGGTGATKNYVRQYRSQV